MNYKLTSSQKNIRNLQTYYEDTTISTICGALFFEEKVENAKLQKALNQIISEQDGLRLRFFINSGEVWQYVADFEEEGFEEREFSDAEAYRAFVEGEKYRRFSVEGGKMYRFVICRVEGKTGVFVMMSHLVSDAWTLGILGNRVAEILYGRGEGRICDKRYSYVNHIESEEQYRLSARFRKDLEFWEAEFAQKPEIAYIKPERSGGASPCAGRKCFRMDTGFSEEIRDFCRASGVTPAVVFEAVWYLYLHKINPECRTITIGTPVLNRIGLAEKETAGMFIATVPLSVSVGEDMTVGELLEAVSEKHSSIFRHQRYPYRDIQTFLHRTYGWSGNLYDVMVSFQNVTVESAVGVNTQWYANGYSEVALAVHIDDREKTGAFRLTLDYQRDVFSDEAEIELLYQRVLYVLRQFVGRETERLADISVLPAEEYDTVLRVFNDTGVEYDGEKCVHQLFEEQAGRTPERVALVFEGRHYSYKVLSKMIMEMMAVLAHKGVNAGDKVCISIERSEYVIVLQMAVLGLNAVFIPIDSRYPIERIMTICEESTPKLFIINENKKDKFENVKNVEYLEWLLNEKCNTDNLPTENDIHSPAYIIYTSGSTGTPKGCILTQKGLINFCCHNNILDYCNTLKKHRVVSVNTISFDYFIAESLLPLLNGYTVILADEETSVSGDKFSKLVIENSVNIVMTTPTRYKIYMKEDCSYFKQFDVLVTSGEALEYELLQKFATYSNAKIYNPLGPSECSVWNLGGELGKSDKETYLPKDISIGGPIANTQIYILNDKNTILPIGIPGELCIAGDGVGLGYLNRPNLTEERFVPNPFANADNHHGAKMYHTGDLACWRTDGTVAYLGRIDTQVKIRGLRIELGEIESVMSAFLGIHMCAVADKKDENGRQYLVGYYNTISDENENQNPITAVKINEKELREHLLSKLPKYMIPNYFVHLPKIPMTASGKIDRKNLPEPTFLHKKTHNTIPPRTKTEETLLQIWRSLFEREEISADDDFFEIGGDSLMAISLLGNIEETFSVRLQMKEIFENATIQTLALLIENETDIEIKPIHKERETYVITEQQKIIYAYCMKNPTSVTYNMPFAIHLQKN